MAEDKRDIENFFKRALDGYEGDIPFNEKHWNQMAEMLDAEMPVVSSPSTTYYYASNLISSIAASILILGLIWNFNIQKQNDIISNREIAGVQEEIVDPVEGPLSESQLSTSSSEALAPSAEALSDQVVEPVAEPSIEMVNAEAEVEEVSSSSNNADRPAAEPELSGSVTSTKDIESDLPVKADEGNRQLVLQDGPPPVINEPKEQREDIVSFDDEAMSSHRPVLTEVTAKPAGLSLVETRLPNSIEPIVVEKPLVEKVEEIIKDKSAASFPRFASTIVFSPDLSSNELGRYNKFGNEFGLLFEYRFTKRFSVELGGLLSSKNYEALASDYNPPAGFWMTATGGETPTSLTAVCRVVDIPINLKYRALEDANNVLAASAGVSSYFMLKEDYEFDMSWGPWSWGAEGENQHIFGVANVQLHYERKFGKLFAIEIAPYAKIPLTGYGHGRIKFHSLGTSIGIKRYFRIRSSKLLD